MELNRDFNDLFLTLHKAQQIYEEGHFKEAQTLFGLVVEKAERFPKGTQNVLLWTNLLRDAREGLISSAENSLLDFDSRKAIENGLAFEEAHLGKLSKGKDDFLCTLDALLFLFEHLYIEEKEASFSNGEKRILFSIQEKISRLLTRSEFHDNVLLFRIYQDAIGAYRMLMEDKDDDYYFLMSSLSTSLFECQTQNLPCPVLKEGKESILHLFTVLEKRKGQKRTSRPEWLSLLRDYLGERKAYRA